MNSLIFPSTGSKHGNVEPSASPAAAVEHGIVQHFQAPPPSSLFHHPLHPFFYGSNVVHQQQFKPFYPLQPQLSPLPYVHQQPRNNFRKWQHALSKPSSSTEKFTIVSYNILADYIALKHRHESYSHIPPNILSWESRMRQLTWELCSLWSPDIICLQEVDRFDDFRRRLQVHGYAGIWKKRTSVYKDGCAVFWRTTRFELQHEEHIEFNQFGLLDNVAQICVFKSRTDQVKNGDEHVAPNHVVVCNIHVLWNSKRGDVKLGQVRMLLNKARDVSKMWNNAPVVVCGDFNCTPTSSLYNFISKQELDVAGTERDKISGQSKALIDPPQEMFNPRRSEWSSTAIKTATGNGECSVVRHQLKLKSVYTQIGDYSGSRDMINKEPQVTCYNNKFMGTVDYIWCSQELEVVKVLGTLSKHDMLWTFGFPTVKWGSDHMAMASELAFKNR